MGELLSIQMLSGNKLVCTHLTEPSEAKVKPFIAKGPYLVGGVTTQPELVGAALEVKTIGVDAAVTRLETESVKRKLKPILLFQGPEDEAIRLAKKYRTLVMIVHRSAGDPPVSMRSEGKTALVTPAEFGKFVVTIKLSRGVASDYKTINLLPEFKDDASVADLYKNYLMRVSEEKLLEQLPRQDTAEYAGPETCRKCHPGPYDVWSKSDHANALASLEKVGHDRDPDCVSCHVTGLNSKQGFTTRTETPDLARVGCESCHGPQKAHSKDPHNVKPDHKNRQKCSSCHDTGHSPNFSFIPYWQKITHR
jgi:hypothetical protein